MARINTKTIKGYTDMSTDEKLAVLENFEYDDKSAELNKYKTAVSKANSEAATYKKQYNEHLREEEKKVQEQNALINKMQKELEQLRQDKNRSSYKGSLLALGYDSALADKAADCLVKGDINGFFEVQKSFLKEYDKAYKALLMNSIHSNDSDVFMHMERRVKEVFGQ